MDSIFSIGGVQRVTAVIAKELSKTCDVTIVTFDNPASQDITLYGLSEAPIHYRFFSYPQIGKLKQRFCKAYSGLYKKAHLHSQTASNLYAHSSFPSELRRPLVQELLQGHYDTIIGVHAPLAARLATLMPQLPGVRCVGWIHNSYEALFSPTSLYIGPELKRHYVYQFRKLHSTVLLCLHDAESYQAYDHRLKTTVIYNPLTLVPGESSKGTSKRFLAIGRFSHLHKGFDLLIEAFRIFAQENQEWTLDIVGGGVEEPIYRKLIKNYQLEDRIHIHPFTNNIQEYYSEAQVYVLSSRWEGFGLVLIEAMAHGLPVISSDLPTSQEIMGDFGMYFSIGDVKGMARRMTEATKLDWQEKSAQAIQIAARFNIDTIIHQWKQLINEK